MSSETATFGAGCFWGVEHLFRKVPGVIEAVSGYSGGFVENPDYRLVCTDTTGHAEVVQVTFDPAVISFADILHVFFTVHDPTTLNRQGADAGTQYRSAIFYHSPEQKAAAEQVIAELTSEKLWPDPVVTQVVPFDKFYVAEDYHQEYYANNQFQPYCRAVITPKVTKFRAKYFDRLKKTQPA